MAQLYDQSRQRSRSPQKASPTVYIYNLPEHHNKDDISYFIWKSIQRGKGSNGSKRMASPIIGCEEIEDGKCIKLRFRSDQDALNCLDLNGIYYGERAFLMKSKLPIRTTPQLDLSAIKHRKLATSIPASFSKIYIGNLPPMPDWELITLLEQYGELKGYERIEGDKTSTECYCEWKDEAAADEAMAKLQKMKIKSRSVIVKRAELMGGAVGKNKSTIIKSVRKSAFFEQSIESYYLTLDTTSFFSNLPISCVLLLQNILPPLGPIPPALADISRELHKIGPIVRIVDKARNVYVEFQRVEYAQIAYLVIMRRKYDGRPIEVKFYDPVEFADQRLL